jgi:hypothetical protein
MYVDRESVAGKRRNRTWFSAGVSWGNGTDNLPEISQRSQGQLENISGAIVYVGIIMMNHTIHTFYQKVCCPRDLKQAQHLEDNSDSWIV